MRRCCFVAETTEVSEIRPIEEVNKDKAIKTTEYRVISLNITELKIWIKQYLIDAFPSCDDWQP